MKNKYIILFIILIALLFLSKFVTNTGSSKATLLTPDKAKELISQTPDLVIIDVRTPEEFREGHIKKAKNMPLDELQADLEKKPLKKDTPILLYCRTGHRSRTATKILDKLGYEKIYDLRGGYVSWQD